MVALGRPRIPLAMWMLCLVLTGCVSPYEARHAGQKSSLDQVLLSEETQLRLRSAQTRVFDAPRVSLLASVIAAMQDLGFVIDVLDDELGVVSGRKFIPMERTEMLGGAVHPSYYRYDDQGLLAFQGYWRAWGPFEHRNDLVRLTVTLRPRGEQQTVVRVSAQFYLEAVEDPEPYQRFFTTIEKGLRLESESRESLGSE